MATSNEPLQLNLGSLRSAMSLTLHTHHASRIWHGRAAAEGRPGIVGLNGYIAVMNKMKRGSEQDDPYSDWWMLRIEDKLDQTRTTLQTLREQVDQALAGVPDRRCGMTAMRMSVRVSKPSQTGIWRHNPHPTTKWTSASIGN